MFFYIFRSFFCYNNEFVFWAGGLTLHNKQYHILSYLILSYLSIYILQVGFKEYTEKFEDCKVDGDLLLQMNDNDLVDSIQMKPGMVRRR